MAELLVQLQPDRLREYSEQSVEQLRRTDTQPSTVQNVNVISGKDNGPYTNICFVTTNAKALGPLVRQQIISLSLQSASIVTCTGSDGWNDYLLLHHFDGSETVDVINAL